MEMAGHSAGSDQKSRRQGPARLGTAAATALLVGLVNLYRWFLSPWLGGHCRFHPTCSEYALQALQRHGPGRAAWLILRRLGRCHPFGGSGYDPVPAADAGPRREDGLAFGAPPGQTVPLNRPAAAGSAAAAESRPNRPPSFARSKFDGDGDISA